MIAEDQVIPLVEPDRPFSRSVAAAQRLDILTGRNDAIETEMETLERNGFLRLLTRTTAGRRLW